MVSTAPSNDRTATGEKSFGPMLTISVVLHLVVLVGIPLAMHFFWKPTKFRRPQTFTLVSMPAPSKAVRAVASRQTARKPEPTVKPATKTDKAIPLKQNKPQPKPEPAPREDLGELEDLLGQIEQPVSSLSFDAGASGSVPSYYERTIYSQVERHWRPSRDDPSIFVIVNFTIHADGSISPVTIKKSSGYAVVDREAIYAIEHAAPFGKLPPSIPGNLEVDYKLIPALRR